MNSNLLIFTLTFDNIILIKLFASLDFNPFYCMGQNVSVPLNNKYMQLKNQISREKIYQFVIDSLKPYDLSGDTISRYLSSVRHLISFMEQRHESIYRPELGDFFISTSNLDKGIGFRHYQRDRRMVSMLNAAMSSTLDLFYPKKPKQVPFSYPGDIGTLAKTYLNSQAFKEKMLARATVDYYKLYLSRFSIAMHEARKTLQTLTRQDITNYLSSVTGQKYCKTLPIKNFLRHLYDAGLLKENVSMALEHIRRWRVVPVISYYEKEEILALETSIERSSALGKRNYAIILLGSRMGLRRSDICNLEFGNIDWDRNELSIIQCKTGKPLTLPLTREVGEALVDYIMNGRPKSPSPKVFLNQSAPYFPIKAHLVTTVVSNCMREAGIDLRGRHHASHSLRHSLATQMLKEKTPLHVISSILGHTTSESTMAYMSVDIDMLLKCSLDVPPVSIDFYEQKGGVLYGRI